MNGFRSIQLELQAIPTLEGAGVRLRRVFGYHQIPRFDPFLLLDDFHSNNSADYLKGFPWHPHRGIETITYLLHGAVEHGDSLGNNGIIESGDVQWMTAGSGIIHQEMPHGDSKGLLWGFQLWANLPSSQKMVSPLYREIKHSDIPTVELDLGARGRVISGELAGVRGPVVDIASQPELYDITLPPHSTMQQLFPETHTVFAYVLEGQGFFFPDLSHMSFPEHVILYGEGKAVSITTDHQPVRFLLVSGKPFNEPIAWSGPIVMNTEQELRQAFEDYRNGTFLKTRRHQ